MNIHFACVVCADGADDAHAVVEFAAKNIPQQWAMIGEIPPTIVQQASAPICPCPPATERYWLLTAIEPPDAILHDPGNQRGRIDQLYAFLSVDEGGEGICGAAGTALVTGNHRLVAGMREIAIQIAKMAGKTVRLVRFTRADDVEIYRNKQ